MASAAVSGPFGRERMGEGIGAKGVGDTKSAKDLLEIMDATMEGTGGGVAATTPAEPDPVGSAD